MALKIPIVSAAMDTVTDHTLAIELAKLGGIGVIHRNLTPEQQASEVSRVKHHLNGLIEKPICVNQNESVDNILSRRESKDYKFHSFPVLNDDGRLVGIVTGNDFEFCEDQSLSIKKIMSTELLTALEGTSIDDAYKLMCKEKKKILLRMAGLGCILIHRDVLEAIKFDYYPDLLASDDRHFSDKATEHKARTTKIMRGLQQPRYGISVRSSFGPSLSRGIVSPRSFMVLPWLFVCGTMLLSLLEPSSTMFV